MTAKIKVRQYVTFNKPRNFDIAETKCFIVYIYLLSLSRNRRDPLKNFEISILRHIKCVVLRKKQFEQPKFTNDYVI